jgi:type VI secretion system protein ImpH
MESTGQLGISTVIGVKSWQCQHKFRIVMGPLTLAEYINLLPSGNRLKSLLDLVSNYIGFEFNWDLNLVLKKDEVPSTQLGRNSRLGWTSWLQAGTRGFDANDLYLKREMLL